MTTAESQQQRHYTSLPLTYHEQFTCVFGSGPPIVLISLQLYSVGSRTRRRQLHHHVRSYKAAGSHVSARRLSILHRLPGLHEL